MSEINPIEGITIKHLSPYLPYGIAVYVVGTIRDLTAVSIDSNFVFITKHKGSREKQMINISKIKPLLRPLSDLTKEIEVNGERFVPNEWLSENMPNTPNFRYMLNSSHNFDLSETIIEWCVMNKLIKWHFDVFDLHSKNLCVYYDELK